MTGRQPLQPGCVDIKPRRGSDLEDRYMPITETGCWIWVGASNKEGYGKMRVAGKNKYAHRIMYEKYKGSIPDGHVLLHTCDNPFCCNPDHLTADTHLENMADMVRKGRASKAPTNFGNLHNKGTLTDRSVIAIRRLAVHVPRGVLAKKFKVTRKTIGEIITNKTWRHI